MKKASIFVAFVFLFLFHTTLWAQSLLFQYDGPSTGQWAGQSVTGVGDINQDGFGDFLIGSPGASSDVGPGCGSVQVFSGKDKSVLMVDFGLEPWDCLGFSAGKGGDYNGDGVADFWAGASNPWAGAISGNAGYVRLYSGVHGTKLWDLSIPSASCFFGFSASDAGDVNHDGNSDLLVGEPEGVVAANGPDIHIGNGKVWVVSGYDGTAIYQFCGDQFGDLFGLSVAGIGDLNQDGDRDFLVGAPDADPHGPSSGLARIFSGRDGSVLFTMAPMNQKSYFGKAVANAGDVNRDGFTDIVIGNDEGDYPIGSNSGSVWVISGKNLQILHLLYVPGFDFEVGRSVCGLGDINLDGYDDIAMGNYFQYDPPTGFRPGVVQVYSGLDGSLVTEFWGLQHLQQFGFSVASAGDVDGDGLPDLIAGGPMHDMGGENSGIAMVYSFRPKGISGYGTGTPGCNGAQTLTSEMSPNLGGFVALRANHAPSAANGFALFATAANNSGNPDPFFLGIALEIDLTTLSRGAVLPMWSDALGYANSMPVSIPNDPSLVGLKFYGQALWFWGGGSCAPSPWGLSTSLGMALEFLP